MSALTPYTALTCISACTTVRAKRPANWSSSNWMSSGLQVCTPGLTHACAVEWREQQVLSVCLGGLLHYICGRESECVMDVMNSLFWLRARLRRIDEAERRVMSVNDEQIPCMLLHDPVLYNLQCWKEKLLLQGVGFLIISSTHLPAPQ